jgi:streptomycin 6-kinase
MTAATLAPRVRAKLARRWSLIEIGEPFRGSGSNIVVPAVDRSGRDLVLKVTSDPSWAVAEYRALRAWDGRGAVRAVALDEELGAMLMERARPGDALRDADVGEDAAIDAFASVARQLREANIPIHGTTASARPESEEDAAPRDRRNSSVRANAAAPPFPTIIEWLVALDSHRQPPTLAAHFSSARETAALLLQKSADWILLHGDLHHENIVRNGAGWIAIDPKGVMGPPEVEAAAFLRNPRDALIALPDLASVLLHRVLRVSKALAYDPVTVAEWGYVMSVLAAAWAIEDGEGDGEAAAWVKCAVGLSQVRDRARAGA